MRKKIFMSFVLGILLFLMIPIMNCEWHENRMPSDLNSVLIVEVYYDTYLKDEPEEYVRLYNPTCEDVDISKWNITDIGSKDSAYDGIVQFPENTILKAGKSIYVANNASAFQNENYFKPDFEYGVNSLHDVLKMITLNPNIRFGNDGDEVILKDEQDNIVDAVVYGDSDYIGTGWDSKSAKGVTEGTVLRRDTDEETGLYLDTNTSSDWDSLRTYKIGQSYFPYETFSFNGNVTCFVSPDSSYEAIVNEMDNAKKAIYISVYQLTSIHVAESLINASKRNITVKVFLEGLPAF